MLPPLQLSKGHGALRLLLCDDLIIAVATALLRTPAMWPARRQMRPPWIQIQRHGEWGIGNLELRELYRAIARILKDHKG